MDELNCSAKLDRNVNKITVSNLANSELEIDISGDVDFTDLVQELTKKIDEEKIIILTIEDEVSITDSKDKLIIETLKKIFDSYNASLQETNEDSNIEEIAF
jgi:predicted nuclease of predicted toxin-antitoxin system